MKRNYKFSKEQLTQASELLKHGKLKIERELAAAILGSQSHRWINDDKN